MFTPAIRHFSFYPFVQPLARTRAKFLLEAASGDLRECELVWWKRTDPGDRHCVPMSVRMSDGCTAQWQCEAEFPEECHYIKYGFRLTGKDGKRCWLNAYGTYPEFTQEGSYERLQINSTDVFTVPAWSKGCVWYQIFPERFARGGEKNGAFDPWEAEPTRDNYLGGDLKGITDHLDHLQDLGVECLYLNPVFLGDFNHKYATTDYMKIDPLFGTEQDLIDLVDRAHSKGIRVVLDGVFNHCGIHFAPFKDLAEKGEKSEYRTWFYPKRFPLKADAACYECVGDYPYMPRLNGSDPGVRAYVKDVLLYWLDTAHIDGWRFDVADELDRHAVTFWREEIKKKYPDAVMLAETWGNARGMLGADGFDCAMNYLFRDAVIDFFARGAIDGKELRRRVESMLMQYPDEAVLSMYNCLGSHDTPRFLTEAKGEKWRLTLAMAFQMLFPGAPAVYYGDETGMTGENDPGCRGGMNWKTPDRSLLLWQKELIRERGAHPAVRCGSFTVLKAEKNIFAFLRQYGDDRVIAVFNTGDHTEHTDLAEAAGFVDVLPHSVKIIH